MDYDKCAELFQKTKAQIAEIEGETKERLKPLKEKQVALLQWMETKARSEGLKNVPTKHGTGYWTLHTSASAAEPGVFKDYVIKNQAFDLLETRASKTAVKSFIEANGAPPPGVNFTQTSVFNIRAAGEKE